MRKMFKTVALTAALLLFTAGKTKADVNVNSTFYITANGQKVTTSAAALKPDDGDNNAYVTTLAAAPNGGLPSTVFSNGGTFYCRTRLAANDSVVSNLFTFKSNQKQIQAYPSGNARYGQYYKLRAEIDGTKISGSVRQSVRWCP